MNKKIPIACIAISLICSVNLSAATLIETMESDGEVEKMWIESTNMRIDSGEGYAIADMEKRKLVLRQP